MQTRYPGVTSFTDSPLSDKLFFGREEDKKKLFFFILSENLTILYSKSGYGKTSLLQAGVFKMLRDENYLPFYIRLNKIGSSPEDIIKFEILDKTDNNVYDIEGANKELGLEEFLSHLEIWSNDNKLVTPALVFDQFEEIFTLEHNFQYRNDFIDQLSAILKKSKEGRLSVKIVLSLREDYLGHLEKLAVKIPSIFSNRFRLEALTPASAKEAIVCPAEMEIEGESFTSPKIKFEPEALEDLLQFLSLKMIDKQWEQTEEVEPVQLQIICSTLEEKAIAEKQFNNISEAVITKQTLGGQKGLQEILVSFYDNQIQKLIKDLKIKKSEIKAIQSLIETKFILNKKRVPIEYHTILENEGVSEKALRNLIDQKLLRVENYQGNKLVEISHDTLVDPILMSKEKRLHARDKARVRLIARTAGILLVIVLAILAFTVHQNSEVSSTHETEDTKEKQKLIDSLTTTKKKETETDRINKIVNSLEIVGLPDNPTKMELAADSALKRMISNSTIASDMLIKFYKKSREQSEVFSTLAVIGYSNIKDLRSKTVSKTNAIYFGASVRLTDIKIVTLALIRGGFKIKLIKPSENNGVQIIYNGFKEDLPAFTVKQIMEGQTVADFVLAENGGKRKF